MPIDIWDFLSDYPTNPAIYLMRGWRLSSKFFQRPNPLNLQFCYKLFPIWVSHRPCFCTKVIYFSKMKILVVFAASLVGNIKTLDPILHFVRVWLRKLENLRRKKKEKRKNHQSINLYVPRRKILIIFNKK